FSMMFTHRRTCADSAHAPSSWRFPIATAADRGSAARIIKTGCTQMPTLTVEGFAPVEVPSGKRLVLAIEQDAKVDVLHACGGNAGGNTCRVEFIDGAPQRSSGVER